jgi:BASS family bile acid:Na+ symporter
MAQASSLGIVVLIVGGVILQWDNIVSLIGTGGLIAIVIFLVTPPTRRLRWQLLALALNFVAVPFVVWAIQAVMDLDQDIYTGLVLMGTAAGAPFLPKLAEAAKGNAALSVGLMVLLMVVTVVYMPIVLPLLLSGVSINAWDIAKSLIFLMLLPLGIALFVKARWSEIADGLAAAKAATAVRRPC